MGPLAQLFAVLNQRNQAESRRYPGMPPEVFNSRLSSLSNQFHPPNPDSSGMEPIVLSDQGPVHGGLLQQESVFAPRRGLPPMPYRDPNQAGPSPPPAGYLAQMRGM